MNAKNNFQNEMTETMQHPDYKAEIVEVVRSNLTPKIKQERILAYHERDIAEALDTLTPEERSRLYHVLDAETLADILEYSENKIHYMDEINVPKRIAVLSRLEITEMAEYVRKTDKAQRATVLELLGDDLKTEIVLLNSFGEEEIGSKMTTNYIAIRDGISVRDAMRSLIDQAAENDNISTIYVVDENKLLLGAIDLKDLIIAREGTRLDAITMTSYPYVYANEQLDDCFGRIKDYSEDSIPVLDSDNKLIGVLTSQNVVELIDEEFGEDYAKLAGLSAEEDLHEPLKKSVGKRLPWLIVLLGLGMIVSGVVGAFEGVVAQLPLIIAFQSLILDMAGNVGTQSLAVTIRVLMDEHISGRQKLHLIAKEARVGLVNGVILGSLSFACIGLYLWLLKEQTPAMAFSVSACTGIALLLAGIIITLLVVWSMMERTREMGILLAMGEKRKRLALQLLAELLLPIGAGLLVSVLLGTVVCEPLGRLMMGGAVSVEVFAGMLSVKTILALAASGVCFTMVPMTAELLLLLRLQPGRLLRTG